MRSRHVDHTSQQPHIHTRERLTPSLMFLVAMQAGKHTSQFSNMSITQGTTARQRLADGMAEELWACINAMAFLNTPISHMKHINYKEKQTWGNIQNWVYICRRTDEWSFRPKPWSDPTPPCMVPTVILARPVLLKPTSIVELSPKLGVADIDKDIA